MEDEFNDLASGVQTFAEIIQEESIYVDKTAFLARMISDKNKVWFLARPRRFGKSLTVSTLEDLFSGRKELFKGLYIESKLDEERFAPRPVVRLDMSDLPADSVEAFEAALGRKTVKIAEELGVTVDPTITPGEILKKTIKKAAEKAGRPVAVLIDEYDAPFVAVMDSLPEEREQFRAAMRAYYAIFKSTDRYISFIFVTGITKAAAHIDLIPAFNSYNDLSINPEYGAICGFTQGELEGYFGHHLKRTAERLKMTETELLEKTRDFYYGFCFDGVTRVYNPFSTLLFFQNQEFKKFWFNTGSSTILADFLKDNRLTVEEFSGQEVGKDFADNPGEFTEANPVSFLYQTGYLSLRPGSNENNFVLDYPNREVREAMDNLLVNNF